MLLIDLYLSNNDWEPETLLTFIYKGTDAILDTKTLVYKFGDKKVKCFNRHSVVIF